LAGNKNWPVRLKRNTINGDDNLRILRGEKLKRLSETEHKNGSYVRSALGGGEID